ncbi:homeobox protein Hox-C4 isoform X2 [Pipistrellus kuhlii]|uniref:homeobox protein Hox-C4 isoform X2 n=1 Tax=Pipistrellus kuhlii TaxID=59472 RepID=UPI001E271659|nr:homeobox protein Hox-C4 isoform X2 [Pipistrellus kuhlii]
MILNYNCYQVQQGDQAPSLGSPFCRPPPPNSVLWDQFIGIGGMTRPSLSGGGGGEKQPFLPLPFPPPPWPCHPGHKGVPEGWRHPPPLGVPSLPLGELNPSAFGRQPGYGLWECVFTCKHMCYMDTIPGPEQALSTQACLPLSEVCPLWGRRRKSAQGLGGHSPGGRCSWQVPLLPARLQEAAWRRGSGSCRPSRRGSGTGSGRGPRVLGWGREAQWVLGRARLLNTAFANHFLSLFSGAQPPRPPEMTSESFASHCLYLPGPAGSLPRRPLGQRVGGALPGDLHGQTGSPGMEAFGRAQEPRPKGPLESSRGDSRRGPSHSLPQPLHAQAGEDRWGLPLLLQGRAVSLWGAHRDTPASASQPPITTTTTTPAAAPPPPHTQKNWIHFE